jgi:hypothetical protein
MNYDFYLQEIKYIFGVLSFPINNEQSEYYFWHLGKKKMSLLL